MKNLIYLITVFFLCMGCDKNELKNSEQEAVQDQTVSNHDLILPESKQYFIADVAGVEGMEKLNYQDNDFEFNLKCFGSFLKCICYFF